MTQTRTQKRIDRIITRGTVAVYGVVWLLVIALWLNGAWLLAMPAAAAYVAGYVFEMVKRGRCWTSADPTALPAAAIAYGVAVVILRSLDYAPLAASSYFMIFGAFGGAFMLAHVLAFAYVAITEQLLLKIYKNITLHDSSDD